MPFLFAKNNTAQEMAYQSLIKRYTNCDQISQLCKKAGKAARVEYVDELHFYNSFPPGTEERIALKALGKPKSTFVQPTPEIDRIYFYKKMVNDLRVKMQLHIKDKQFVLGVLTFDYLSNNQKAMIFQSIAYSYGLSSMDKDTVIKDSRGNYCLVLDEFYFEVVYIERNYFDFRKEKINSLDNTQQSYLPLF